MVLPYGELGLFGFTNRIALSMSNCHFYYQGIDLSYAINTKISDVSSRYTASNCFTIVAGNNIQLIRCEASRAQAFENGQAALGDGFNSSKYSRYTMTDCWSHDNADDAQSDHLGAIVNVYGGLFEYNNSFGKGSGGGFVPTSNCALTVYGATVRNNDFGMLANGTSTINAVGCISKANKTNYAISGTNQSMLLKDCISLNATQTGYSNATGSYMELLSCQDFGSVVQKNNSGTYLILNSNVS
jgi:hypothetical protein